MAKQISKKHRHQVIMSLDLGAMTSVPAIVASATIINFCWTLVMAVTFCGHDNLVSVLFEDLLSHSYNFTFSMFLFLVTKVFI